MSTSTAGAGRTAAAPEVGRELLYLTRDEVVGLGLGDDDVLELVRTALVEHGTKRYEMPAKIGLHPLRDTLMHAMPAHVPAARACGIKWASCFPENERHGLAQTSGVLVLNDPQTGWPLALMDAIWITARRTPAVSALACEKLARADSTVLGIIGCGVQGSGHLEVLPRVLPNLEEVRLFDARPDVAGGLAASAGAGPSVRAVESVEEVVRDADVVVSATAILFEPDPLVRHGWVKEGALILPVDFDSVWEWETLSGADKFLVDSVEEMEYFRTVGYLPHGLPPVHAEIGEVVAGVRPGRESADELIIDMNIGMGVEDVVVARALYDRALELGVGRLLPL
jgi:ornithine cyclodeaminase/alanine dehydrogenase-like protein (mu-crystallin family)